MSSARFLNLPARSGYAVRSKYNGAGPGAPAAPGSGGCCRPRRAHPSSSLRCHSAGVVARAADPGDGEAATAASTGGVADGRTLGEIKIVLLQSLQGIDRGIFGLPSQRRSEIEGFVRLLESLNPTPLLYSTITILGTKRTKLGLRDFISLGDFFQRIDVAQGKAINEISFSARGFKTLSGKLTIVASFEIASETRVNIRFEQSDIKNYDLLLAIFNPEGWLEITYLDESIRIGRDDKGNVFILERAIDEKASQSPEPFTLLGSR
ncbi:unnamed protein product [Spirodela intermedia]|uniref:Plastid lipid-associated protein/fibrillin conserved domain-containing protein n=1 Tax=Spirodela intermedia TaxID=51605 RepID=A0A7I8ISM6_SPIIN|nr:unnamed protein product [Spirodela intermedia]CAA6660530.1 unnamed protein product [Spirodela intermedia]